MADRPESSKQAAAPTTDWSLTAGSSTWNKLFDRYYRKKEVCWPPRSSSLLAICPLAMLISRQVPAPLCSLTLSPALTKSTRC
jgi:hypothetical protein